METVVRRLQYIPKIGCHYFWHVLIAIPQNTIPFLSTYIEKSGPLSNISIGLLKFSQVYQSLLHILLLVHSR
jgi:hypothetical protein